jgi:hypothetical protein
MSSQPTGTLTPIATTRGLGHLTLALGFTLRQRPPRRSLLRQEREGQKLLRNLRRGPNDLGSEVSIGGATGVGFDTLHQPLSLFGTQMHFLEAFEQPEASKHDRLHLQRD